VEDFVVKTLSTRKGTNILLRLVFAAGLLFPAQQLVAQTTPTGTLPANEMLPAADIAADDTTDDTAGFDAGQAAEGVRPRSFRGISLGMSRAEVQDLLAADDLFFYRGEPDVSLLPRPNEVLLEVSGLEYVKRAFFQFHEDRLFIMIFSMNERKIDHYSIFTSLSAKYGKPDSLSPAESIWQDEQTRVSLERPLAVKYIDQAIFSQLQAEGEALENFAEILRQDFLNDF